MAACNNTTPANSQATVPATVSTPAAIDGNLLTANHWVLDNATDSAGKRIDALFVRADKPVTLNFIDGRLAVDNTCNRMGGGYTVAGSTLTVSPMASTMMACADQTLMALDQAVGSRLEGTLKIEQLDAATLKLSTAAGDVLTLRGEPTAETRYGGPGATVFLEVDARAHLHPTRQAVIRQAGLDLVARLRTLCPACQSPGFGLARRLPGLLCGNCGTPTAEFKSAVMACAACGHETEERIAEAWADPAHCPECNP